MNRQPFKTPPTWWEPKMTPWLVRLWRPLINRTLRNHTRFSNIEVHGIEHIKKALSDKAGILITPNHSFHYDSYVMIEAGHRVGSPFHFMSAWQVFEMSSPMERWVLQRHGCFSINREGNDLRAFKQGVDLLKESPYPLVIFPEGDIYHSNDRVTPFRDGAAAVAMSAAKKSDRPIVTIPVALKAHYVKDPRPELEQLMTRLEESLHWRARKSESLPDRIYKFAEGVLTLKELEYLGAPFAGTLAERTQNLACSVLRRIEQKNGVSAEGGPIPERVKEMRRAVITASEKEGVTPEQIDALSIDMEDLFFVMQLFSYPGDYLADKPSLERIAETLDKFEEDVLKADYPGIRGERHVTVRFGEPIEVPRERGSRDAIAQWTDQLEGRVQGLLDQINASRGESR